MICNYIFVIHPNFPPDITTLRRKGSRLWGVQNPTVCSTTHKHILLGPSISSPLLLLCTLITLHGHFLHLAQRTLRQPWLRHHPWAHHTLRNRRSPRRNRARSRAYAFRVLAARARRREAVPPVRRRGRRLGRAARDAPRARGARVRAVVRGGRCARSGKGAPGVPGRAPADG